MLPSKNSPIWSSSERRADRPPLEGDRSADVVVVGGGIAGLTTALVLARHGLEVTVLEAISVGAGTTGHTTAKVSALQGTRYQTIAEHHGSDVLRSYARAQEFAVEWIASTIGGLETDCRWERRPAVTYATDPESLVSVHSEARAAGAAGLDVELTGAVDLPFDTVGAVVLADQAQFDPVAYLCALADELDRLPNATVHEHSRVTSIRGLGHQKVTTAHGTVTAGAVVVCTLLPIVDRGLFFARGEPKMSYTIAATIDGPLPTGMYLSAGKPSRSLRIAWDGTREVLVVGGEGHVVGRTTDTIEQYRRLERWTVENFDVDRIVARWCAHDVVPDDHLPWVGPASPATPSVYVAGGFAKWGMTNATAAAQVIADSITGRADGPSSRWSDAYRTVRIPPRALEETARINFGVATNMVSGWLRRHHDETGEGAIGRSGLIPEGRSRGRSGEMEQRGLVCSHLGGICAWNDAERTWDCPLHGSRFASDGTVVAAPAVRPMGPG